MIKPRPRGQVKDRFVKPLLSSSSNYKNKSPGHMKVQIDGEG